MIALLRRELLTSLRNPASFVLVLITFGFAIVVTYFNLEDEVSLTQAGQTAQAIFTNFSGVLLAAGVLFIAPVAAVSVCAEKQNDTFTLLRLTGLSPGAIVLGKALNAVGLYLMVVIASFPIVGTLFFLVGVDWEQFTQAMLLLLMTGVTVTMIGVLCSTWFNNSIAAIVATFLGMLGLLMGLPIFVVGSPMMGLLRMTDEPSWWAFLPTAVFEGVVTVVCYLGARQSLFFTPPTPIETHAPPPAWHVGARGTGPTRPPLPAFGRFWQDRYEFGEAGNPIYLKELAASSGLRRTLFVVSLPFLALLFAAISLGVAGARGNELAGARWLLVQGALVAVAVPGLLATALAREAGQNSLDMLRMALVTPAMVVSGHVRAALLCLAPLIAAMLLGAVPLLLSGLNDIDALLRTVAALGSGLVAIALSLGIAVVAAVMMPRAVTAVLAAYAFGMLATVGLFALSNALLATLFGFLFDPSEAYAISAHLSPIASCWWLAENVDSNAAFVAAWLVSAGVYAALAAAAVWGATVWFTRYQLKGS